MERIYDQVVSDHFASNRQMLFLHGPRQVGKTTTARASAAALGDLLYLNFDNLDDRRLLLRGPGAIAEALELDRLREAPPTCVLDEIHKLPDWKTLLKGLFDSYGARMRLLVTGSARLEVFGTGGDSLMGRYLSYRLHPLSVAELVGATPSESTPWSDPKPIESGAFERLQQFGGFPEPYLRADRRFWRQWRRLRSDLLFREDLRDLSRIQETARVEVVAELLRERVGGLVSYASLARGVRASVDTISRWIATLEALHYCFAVRPWFRNVTRALRKEPKYYLWDWSLIDDPGARAENLVACALLKAVHFWTDSGFGDFDLRFIRDKEKREVDFIVIRDREPWFLVEVKQGANTPISPALHRFQKETDCAHAFQVVMDLDFVARDCFAVNTPVVVPAATFLSQLV